MFRNKSDEDVKYLVLSVREGFGFGCLKNLLLRISPVFEDQRLISDYVFGVSEPKFNFHFIWCTTDSHLKRLQKRRSTIQIDIWATKSDQTWAAGYAVIGAQHAEIVTPNVSISYRRLHIQNVKSQFGMRPPELFVTLNVQCSPFVAVSAKVYLANITDVPTPKYCSSGRIQRASNVATVTKKTVKAQKSYDQPPPPKQKNSDPPSSIDPNQKQSNKDTRRRTVPKPPKLNDKKIESSKPAKPNTNPSAKPNTEPSATPNADSATPPDEDQQEVPVPFHQYQLEMQCGSVDWYAALTNVKMSLRFCNPTDNSLATAIENEDLNLLNVFLPQIICRAYYISIPNNLLKTVLCHPPLLLISKAYTNQVIIVGSVKVKYMQADPKMEHFQSYIELITKEKEIVGHISVMITFQDLGVISSLTDHHPTNCISKFQQHDKPEAKIGDLAKDFARLLKIHEKLKATYSKIAAGFQKFTENPIPHHNLNYRPLMEPKFDNYIKVIDTDEFVNEMKQESAAQQSKGVQKQVSFYVFPKHGETTKKASAAQYKSLKGILKETTNTNSGTLEEAHLRKTVPDNINQPCCSKSLKEPGLSNEVTFSNKDCNHKRQQLQVQETCPEQTNKGSRLIEPLDVLRNTNKQITENYPGKDKCNYLNAAQHVLTQSLLHTQHANTQLEIEYSNAIKELESLKENVPYIEMKRYARTQDLKHEINEFRHLHGLTIKIVEDEDQKESSVNKDKKAETAPRKNSCEACKVLSKLPKDIKPKQFQSPKGSKSSKEKTKKSYQPRIFDTNIDEICAQMDYIRTRLQLYLEKRDELIRIHQYHCGNPLVIYMTHTIRYLSTAWFNLRIELELLVSS